MAIDRLLTSLLSGAPDAKKPMLTWALVRVRQARVQDQLVADLAKLDAEAADASARALEVVQRHYQHR